MVMTLDDRIPVPQWSDAGDFFPDQAEWSTFFDAINDAAALDAQGLRAARPAAAPANRGLFYFATDGTAGGAAKGLARSDGAAWHDLALLAARPDFIAGATVTDGAPQLTAAYGTLGVTRGAAGGAYLAFGRTGSANRPAVGLDANDAWQFGLATAAAAIGTLNAEVGAAGNVKARGADHYFGANAFAGSGTRVHLGSIGDAANAYLGAEGSATTVGLVLRAQGAAGTIRLQPDATTTILTVAPTALTLAVATTIAAGGLAVTGSPSGYAGIAEVLGHGAGGAVFSTDAGATPEIGMHHRGAGNNGKWTWANTAGAAVNRMTLTGAGRLTVYEDLAMGQGATTGALRTGDGATRLVYFDAGTVYVGAVDGTRAAILRGNGLDVVKARTDGLAQFGTGASAGAHESYRLDAVAFAGGNGFAYACDSASHPGGVNAGLSIAINRGSPAASFTNAGGDTLRLYGGTILRHQFFANGGAYFNGESLKVGTSSMGGTGASNLWFYGPSGDANVYLTAESVSYADVSFKIRAKGAAYVQLFTGGGTNEVYRIGNGLAMSLGNTHHFGQGAFGLNHAKFSIYADTGGSDVWLYCRSGTDAFDRALHMRAGTDIGFWDGSGNYLAGHNLLVSAGAACMRLSYYDNAGTFQSAVRVYAKTAGNMSGGEHYLVTYVGS